MRPCCMKILWKGKNMMNIAHYYAKENALTFLGNGDNRFPSVMKKGESLVSITFMYYHSFYIDNKKMLFSKLFLIFV